MWYSEAGYLVCGAPYFIGFLMEGEQRNTLFPSNSSSVMIILESQHSIMFITFNKGAIVLFVDFIMITKRSIITFFCAIRNCYWKIPIQV